MLLMGGKITPAQIKKFQKTILDYYAANGRTGLPWRKKTRTPYQVLVSEVMLQQTQVDRVIPFFHAWMKEFPTFRALAQARQADVLRLWKGLGYNSRALRLHRLAQVVTEQYQGRLPRDRQQLEALPGIGPYTAGAIRVFAFEESDIFVETNIRRIFIHYFFSEDQNVSDADIMTLVEKTLPSEYPLPSREGAGGGFTNPHPRIESRASSNPPPRRGRETVGVFTWYSALMDYGSTLPKILKKNPNTQSKHYTKQSKFEGSDRQIRGKMLEILLKKNATSVEELFGILGDEKKRYKKILQDMEAEGFIAIERGKVFLK